MVDDGDSGFYIDKSAKKVLAPKGLVTMWPFRDGLTVAGSQGKQKYINRKGRVVADYEAGPMP